jgi:hypothetical protein
MDTAKPAATAVKDQPKNGLYVRGVVISNRAFAFRRKDGSGMGIKVQHEVALQPGLAVWERYFDPRTDKEVKFDGDKVLEFPQLPEFQQITLRADRFKVADDKFVITQATEVRS